MSWQRSVRSAVKALRDEEQSLNKQLASVRARIAELTGMAGKRGRPAGPGPRRVPDPTRLSDAGRRAISLAAKRRWAKYRGKKAK